ncbi:MULTISPECIES: helix-turn-helix transcriptional regulator [Cellulomonadaceae]|jgi:DNA-binding transcriptional ArsR family regulator|uniref:ArsR/SmtB family transcription factor n=1 Tax=Cellulomonadaceae TaxID=85016 RepID=UPI00166886A3|nr:MULTISPECIES: metalloregulator ArsR/SmtB family transcription factor [Cellulomonadaceae]MDT0166635.1 metalloregulator ArsR/SmtB family transcription factor [Actinotalea sp. AC32]GGC14256.1 putative transcriptional regulator, ArsR family protein [Cellulomonas carbonis]
MPMIIASPDVSGRVELAPAGALFRGLGDPTRLALVRRLATGEARVVDLCTELGLSQSTVSSHLACLRECGLVDYRAQGRASVYHLTRPELLDLLAVAEGLLAATGNAVALCPTYARPTTSDPITKESAR